MRPKTSPIVRGLAIVLLFALVSTSAAQDFQVRTRVDLVVVPVSVEGKDDSLVAGLNEKDFVVYEDGKRQTIEAFSIDPAPLSAVLVIDSGLSPDAFSKVLNSIVAMTEHFSEADEMAVYRFDKHITRLSDFTSDKAMVETALRTLNDITPPAASMLTGPFSLNGPSVNGIQILPGPEPRTHISLETKRLNDALFLAAEALESRGREKRKIILVVSDGQNRGNANSYEDTRDRLLEVGIQVYAVGMDHAFVSRGLSVLDSYADDTGGNACFLNSQNALEGCISRSIEQARNQYVLGYVSNQSAPGGLPVVREIRVELSTGDYKTRHRKGYFQVP